MVASLELVVQTRRNDGVSALERLKPPDLNRRGARHRRSRQLEKLLAQVIERRDAAREDSAKHKMILRQMEGIRHGSELGGLLMEEYDSGSVSNWG